MAKRKSTPKKNTKELIKEADATTPIEEVQIKEERKVEVVPEVKEEKVETKEEKKIETKTEVVNNIKDNNILFYIIYLLPIVAALVYFGSILVNSNSSIMGIITSFLLTLFSIMFFVLCITAKRKKKLVMLFGSLLLFAFYVMNIGFGSNVETYGINRVENFAGQKLTNVVKWANDNHINLIQDYEYSDIVPEYEIISQSVKSGTSINDIEEITVSISEGPNPHKEVVVPSMLTWNADRVLNFIKTNYLDNVVVEFVESDQMKDTVTDQSKSGNLQRSDEIKLTFSFGENPTDIVLLEDFTNWSKFETEFYLKQHKLNYTFEEEYSNKIKKGNVISQDINPGTSVESNGKNIKVVISKGPKIKVPELNKMNVTEVTEWAIKNKLKLEFINQYDGNVKKGKIISASAKKDDIVEQGSTIKVYISLGGLKMPKFKDIDSFYKWADKYEIKYVVNHEFSDTVPAGEVIKYSYKNGDTIKNGDAITVTISDGQKKTVPNLDGLSKNAAISKLNEAGLNYNFVYRNSTKSKDTVIGQSISAGSEISAGATVTVTLSNGKKETNTNTNNGGNNNSGNNGGGNSGGNNTTPPPAPPIPQQPDPTPTCTPCKIYGIKSIVRNNLDGGYGGVSNALRSSIQSQCPGISINIYPVPDAGTSGIFADGDSDGEYTTCDTINIGLAQ